MPFVPERLSTRFTSKALERAFWICVVVCVLGGIVLPTSFGYALVDGPLNNLWNYILVIISKVLEVLLNTFGNLILLFVDMIISVAQYNDFVNAKPVTAGWPLVRDIVNMFFIVVLLITAFSTIIQYKKFQYNSILPKLLLMAILVNFSKMFIGLLIDVSQVVMLTFVNGFQAAAAGNFVQVLKLDVVVAWAQEGRLSDDISSTANPENAALRDSMLLRIVMAEILGMFILGISLTTLAIMLVYLVVRVVGLWMSLIFSPAAFLALAIESTPVGKGLTYIGDNFWPRLSAFLVGGPIMAFFLWLTLATVQTGGFMDFDTLEGRSARSQEQGQGENISYFATKVGTAEEVATFLVAVLMLLAGVEAAVSVAGKASAGLGGMAKTIKAKGMAATRFATYGAASMAGNYVGGKIAAGGGRLATGTGRYVERKMNLAGNAGKLMQTVANAPVIRRLPGTQTLAEKGAKFRAVRGARIGEFKKEQEARTANMATEEKMKFFERAQKSGNTDEKIAAEDALTALMGSKMGAKVLKKRFTEQGKKQGLTGAALDAFVAKQSRVATAQQTAALKKTAEASEDEKKLERVGELLEKRPDMLADLAEAAQNEEEQKKYDKEFDDSFTKMIEQKGVDHVKKTVGIDAWQNSRSIDAVLSKTDILDANGEWDKNSEWYKKLVKGGGMRAQLFEEHRQTLLARAGSPAGIKAEAARGKPTRFYTKEGDKWVGYDPEQLRPVQGGATPGRAQQRSPLAFQSTRVVIRNRRAAAQDPTASASSLPRRVEDLRTAQYDGMKQGARMSQVYATDKNGAFTSSTDRQNFRQNVQQFMQDGTTNYQQYQALDTSDLYQKMGERHQMRSEFVSSSNVGNMAMAWQAAQVNDDKKTQKSIKDAVNLIHQEGSRVESRIATHNRTHADAPISLEAVATAAAAHDQEALSRAVAPMGADAITMEEAEAIERKNQVNADPRLENLRSTASSRAAAAAGRGGAATPPPPPPPPPVFSADDEEETEDDTTV